MKLQKQLSRKAGNIEYPKYVVVIPPKVIEQVRFKEGEELDVEVQGNKLILKKK